MSTSLALARRLGAAVLAVTMAGAVLTIGNTAYAADVATVPLGTSANYSVLGASTVTNTGPSVLNGSLGLWPGTSITGFPPGLVNAPGSTQTTTPAAQQAQADLTFKCDVDYRGYVSDVDIKRNPSQRRRGY